MSASRFLSHVSRLPPAGVIAALAALLFIPFLGKAHLFDWDEINFAEAAREMLVTGNFARVQIDFQPFWEKPPLFLWMQAAAMRLFGVNEFAARLPNAVCGILTLCLLFLIGKKYFDAMFGWLWTLVYAGSFLPHFYFKSGIIDPWFNLFIFSGIYFLIHAAAGSSSLKYFFFAGVCIGLGILTKGPVALLITLLVAFSYSVVTKRKWFSPQGIAVFFTAMLLVPGTWLVVDFLQHGTFFLREFIQYQFALFSTGVAGHAQPFYYHFPVLLIGCFPASVFALSGFFNKQDTDEKQQDFRLWMMILFWVTLFLFSIVKTKIIHYSSLCYFPLTFLAAWEIRHRIKSGLRFSHIQIALLFLIGISIGMAVSLLPYFGRHPEFILPYIKDAFAKANLEANVQWRYALVAFGFAYWTLAFASIFWLVKGRILRGAVTLFVASALLLQASLFFFVPRIERYTQGAAIDFYQSLRGKDAYVEPLGFKSYAHLFYSDKQPQQNTQSRSKEWLLSGAIDKPAYFVCKITKAEEYKTRYHLEEINRKNGFVFLKREPD